MPNRFEPLIKELEQADRLLKDHSEEIKKLRIDLKHKEQAAEQVKEIRAAVIEKGFTPDALLKIKRILNV
jgi:hypothetical protein